MWPDLLFRRTDLSAERLKDVFTAWLTRADSLRVVRSLYQAGSYGKGFLEFRFLSLAQAVEAFHHRAYPSRAHLSNSDFRKLILKPIRAALSVNLSDRVKRSIESAIAFGNQLSYRERLTDLFTDHSAALATVVPAPADWIAKIKKYRNDFTHHPPDRDAEPLDHEDVLRCVYILKILLELAFLHTAGFSPDELVTFAARNHRYSQIKDRFFAQRTDTRPADAGV